MIYYTSNRPKWKQLAFDSEPYLNNYKSELIAKLFNFFKMFFTIGDGTRLTVGTENN
jgi:hypothetical protein